MSDQYTIILYCSWFACSLVGTIGTPAILMNHLPNPHANCNCAAVTVAKTDDHLILWFQAKHDIAPHSELCWDYGIGSFFRVPKLL